SLNHRQFARRSSRCARSSLASSSCAIEQSVSTSLVVLAEPRARRRLAKSRSLAWAAGRLYLCQRYMAVVESECCPGPQAERILDECPGPQAERILDAARMIEGDLEAAR